MPVLDSAGGVVSDCRGAPCACTKAGVPRRQTVATMADAVKMRMVIPFHVEKPRNSAMRNKKLIPTKFGKCLILMWPFGETSEAAMRALNIVVKRTGPRWRRRAHVPISGWSSTNPAAYSQRVHFVGRLQWRHNGPHTFFSLMRPVAKGRSTRFRAHAPFRAFYPCQGQELFQPHRGHSSIDLEWQLGADGVLAV
jgi:hypothetical protein